MIIISSSLHSFLVVNERDMDLLFFSPFPWAVLVVVLVPPVFLAPAPPIPLNFSSCLLFSCIHHHRHHFSGWLAVLLLFVPSVYYL